MGLIGNQKQAKRVLVNWNTYQQQISKLKGGGE